MFRFPSPSLSWRWVGRLGKKKEKKKNEHMIAYEISRLVCKISLCTAAPDLKKIDFFEVRSGCTQAMQDIIRW